MFSHDHHAQRAIDCDDNLTEDERHALAIAQIHTLPDDFRRTRGHWPMLANVFRAA